MTPHDEEVVRRYLELVLRSCRTTARPAGPFVVWSTGFDREAWGPEEHALEAAFSGVAARFARRRQVSGPAWAEFGVPEDVLRAAGIA